MKPYVIIMMSTYNGEKFIEKQLDSIFIQQTDCEIELYVRDDGSSDSTLQILKNWEEKIKINYVDTKNSLGAAMSFWEIVRNVPKADYYAFVDQDDVWDAGKLKCAIEKINNAEIPMLWFSNCRLIDADDNVIKESKHVTRPVLTIPSQLVCGSAQGCAMVFNNRAMEVVLGSKVEYVPMHDIVFMVYILAEGTVLYEDIPLFSYRLHGNNVVEKNGKSFYRRVKDSLNQWFGRKNKYMISKFARSILEEDISINPEDREYLELLIKCKKSLKARRCVIRHRMTVTSNKKALKSFKIRVALGII